jgi:hypothetical protein
VGQSIPKLTLSLLVILITSLSIHTTNAAGIGKVTEQNGPTEIQRNKEVIPSEVNSPLEANDVIVTATAKAGLTFEDDTKVQITEHSKLVIDSFVYDPASKNSAGKLGMKIAMGTVRYASGQIAKNDPASVKIETPTATIGVRGTDFSMTVDEIGRSLVVLLPSCPVGFKNIDKDCKVGVIDVTSGMGTVTLTQAFQSTYTTTRESNPLKPRKLDLTENQINNLLILTPPKVDKQEQQAQVAADGAKEWWKTDLDKNYLDGDLLQATKIIGTDFLRYDRLNRNFLDSNFLSDFLDQAAALLREDFLKESTGALPGYNPATGLRFSIEGDKITLYNIASIHIAEITVDVNRNSTINLQQNGILITQKVNTGGSVITIKQSF